MKLNGKLSRNRLTDPSSHSVNFYLSDQSLVAHMRDYLVSAIRQGGDCVLIVRAIHIEMLCRMLEKDGNSMPCWERCRIFNADSVMAEIMLDGRPDRNKFFTTMGKIFANSPKESKSIKVFCEIVDILWGSSNKKAVLQLENLWNELSKVYSFSLYCAYSDQLFANNGGEKDTIGHFHDLKSLNAGA